MADRYRARRVEAALDHDLAERKDIGSTERAALRAQARAIDVAEAMFNPELVTKANDVYLHLRTAAGLTAAGARPTDAFDQLVAELGRASASDSNTADAG